MEVVTAGGDRITVGAEVDGAAFALVLGVVFLKERVDLVKVFATMTTLIGVVLLRIARH